MMGGGVNVVGGQRGSTPSFKGSIDNVIIENITAATPVGSYTVPTTPNTTGVYVGDYNKDIATATAAIANGRLTGVTVTNAGANYDANTSITISAPDGTESNFQATATATLTDGIVTGISVTNNGDFYNSANTTLDAAAEVTATATATVNSAGDVSLIAITNPGAGYTAVPTVNIADISQASVPYQQIEFDDNWGVITTIEDI
jgi:hypothetical protein